MPNIKYELNEKIHAIIINPYLTWEDFCANCELIKKFQFGDGFGPPITLNDVEEILKITGSQNQIKVVGGIKKLTQVIDLFDNGISYVGTSNFCEIFQEVKVI